MTAVIITGASMGIGRELALGWARRGRTVVLSARNEEALDRVAAEIDRAGGKPVVVAGDVTVEAYRQRLIERALSEARGIEVLVNNAGRGYYAGFGSIELSAFRDLLELNLLAPLSLSQLALPALRSCGGSIVMLSSVAGVVAAPRYGAYAASKFALEGLSMAMRAELASAGVRVVVVRPGPVDTPFRKNATRAADETGYTSPDERAQRPEAVAERTIRAVERGHAVDETSPFVQFASAVSRWTPPMMRIALARMAKRPPPE